MVIVFDANAAVTPEGNPVGTPMPVAPVVVCVMAVNAVLMHNVGVLEAALTVLLGFTVTMTLAQPVVLQVPLARTKYVVVAVGETVIEVPVPADVPPQLPANHW